MSALTELLGQRAEFVAQLDALDAKATDTKLTDDEDEVVTKEIEEIVVKMKKLDGKINLHRDLEKIKAAAAKPVEMGHAGVDLMVGGVQRRNTPTAARGGYARVESGPQPWEEKGILFARFVKCWAAAGGQGMQAADLAKSMYPEDGRLDIRAAMQQNTASGGGFLVPEQASRELVEYLRHRTTVRPNARTVPISGTMTMPVLKQGSAGSYIGEGLDDNAQDLVLGQRRLTARKLRAMVAVSNDLMRNSSPEADMMVRDDLGGALGEAEDLAFIRGSGAGDNPKGMRYWAPTAGVNNGSGTTSAAIETDLIGMVSRLAAAKKSQLRSPRWFMPSRSFYKLYELRHAIGADVVSLVFPEIRSAMPTLMGYPVSRTDQIPITLGGGTETEIYLVDMGDAIIGDEMSITVAISADASYKNEAGTLVSAFSLDQTVLRAIAKHDFIMTRDEAVQILTGSNVTW